MIATLDHSTPSISIIVPVYNSEQYLSKCLDALLNQTFSNIEILCINDGSTDNSLAILDSYSKRDYRVSIVSQPNSGVAKARDVGLRKATAPFFMFCDSDDWYEPNMCEEMLSAVQSHNVDFVMCDTTIVPGTGEHHREEGSIEYHRLKLFGKSPLDNNMKLSINAVLWNKIFRADLIKNHNILFPHVAWCDDVSFIHQYFSVSKTCFGLNKKLYNYLLRGDSLMGQIYSFGNIQKYDFILALSFTLDFLIRHNLLNNNAYFLEIFDSQAKEWLKYLSPDEQYLAVQMIMHSMSNKVDDNLLYSCHFLHLCKHRKYLHAVKFLASNGNVAYKVGRLSIFEHRIKPTKISYHIFGLQLFKIRTSGTLKRYYILGAKVWSFTSAM